MWTPPLRDAGDLKQRISICFVFVMDLQHLSSDSFHVNFPYTIIKFSLHQASLSLLFFFLDMFPFTIFFRFNYPLYSWRIIYSYYHIILLNLFLYLLSRIFFSFYSFLHLRCCHNWCQPLRLVSPSIFFSYIILLLSTSSRSTRSCLQWQP